jgi:hypothetical protein
MLDEPLARTASQLARGPAVATALAHDSETVPDGGAKTVRFPQ